jgi:hypothetical protein
MYSVTLFCASCVNTASFGGAAGPGRVATAAAAASERTPSRRRAPRPLLLASCRRRPLLPLLLLQVGAVAARQPSLPQLALAAAAAGLLLLLLLQGARDASGRGTPATRGAGAPAAFMAVTTRCAPRSVATRILADCCVRLC